MSDPGPFDRRTSTHPRSRVGTDGEHVYVDGEPVTDEPTGAVCVDPDAPENAPTDGVDEHPPGTLDLGESEVHGLDEALMMLHIQVSAAVQRPNLTPAQRRQVLYTLTVGLLMGDPWSAGFDAMPTAVREWLQGVVAKVEDLNRGGPETWTDDHDRAEAADGDG